MARMVNYTSALLLFLSLISCVSCGYNERIDAKDIEKNATNMMECIVSEDSESLLDYYNNDLKSNYTDQSLYEIRELFDYIDGKIVSFEYKGQKGSEESKDNGKINYYNCYPEFEVTTDRNKKYTIEFYYSYIWKDHPELEGINMISIREGKDWSTEFLIGKQYNK